MKVMLFCVLFLGAQVISSLFDGFKQTGDKQTSDSTKLAFDYHCVSFSQINVLHQREKHLQQATRPTFSFSLLVERRSFHSLLGT